MSCSAEASQKEDGKKVGDPWKKVGDPGKKVGDPRRAEAPWPASFPSPSMVPWSNMRWARTLPSRPTGEGHGSLPRASQGLSAPIPPNLWPDTFLRRDELVPLGCSPVPSAVSSWQGQLPVPPLNQWLVMRQKVPIGPMWWAIKNTSHHGNRANRVSRCSPATGIC